MAAAAATASDARQQSSSSSSTPPTKLPVTVLSGFLGAGKTTLLQSVLQKAQGMRIAVIVNDMSAINIDAQLLKATTSQPSGTVTHRVAEKLVEMQNGCICCTLREDLMTAVAELAAAQQFDWCIIESTGISEPLPVAETFTFETEDGLGLADVATLDTLVTVVDASTFRRELALADALKDRGLAADDEDERTVSELMINQVEFANILLLNKADLVSESEMAQLQSLLRQLNPDARLISTVRGDVDLPAAICTGLFDFEKAAEAPGWLKALNSDKLPETEEYGISSFVYRARRPFHPERLMQFLEQQLPTVIRSKGFFWLATRHSEMGIWSQAGGAFAGDAGNAWWAATPQKDWPEDQEERSCIQAEFDGVWGDRRQELVFIGIKMDEAALRCHLNSALLTDSEMQLGPEQWREFHDEFPLWSDDTDSPAYEAMREPERALVPG